MSIDFGPAPAPATPPSPEAAPAAPAALVHVPSIATAPSCGNPSCPACSNRVGGKVCTVTGQTIWDPIDIISARGYASMILGGISWVGGFLRDDKQKITPTNAEIEGLARAIQKVTYRRLNVVGAWDDLVLFFSALGFFVARTISTPEQKPALPAPSAQP